MSPWICLAPTRVSSNMLGSPVSRPQPGRPTGAWRHGHRWLDRGRLPAASRAKRNPFSEYIGRAPRGPWAAQAGYVRTYRSLHRWLLRPRSTSGKPLLDRTGIAAGHGHPVGDSRRAGRCCENVRDRTPKVARLPEPTAIGSSRPAGPPA